MKYKCVKCGNIQDSRGVCLKCGCGTAKVNTIAPEVVKEDVKIVKKKKVKMTGIAGIIEDDNGS